jgi:hypothetical protein
MSITAVLTLYKRPHTLIEQLYAVQNQSVPPENIIIWKNYAEGVVIPEIPIELKKNEHITKILMKSMNTSNDKYSKLYKIIGVSNNDIARYLKGEDIYFDNLEMKQLALKAEQYVHSKDNY